MVAFTCNAFHVIEADECGADECGCVVCACGFVCCLAFCKQVVNGAAEAANSEAESITLPFAGVRVALHHVVI
jgi:hypothetical protein